MLSNHKRKGGRKPRGGAGSNAAKHQYNRAKPGHHVVQKRKEGKEMKKTMVVFAVMVTAMVLSLGTAFAGDDGNLKDVGTMLYLEWLKPHETMSGAPAVKDFGRRGPIASEALVDVGTALYNEAFPKESIMPEKSGAAAGGVTRGDENTRIWDNLMPRGYGSAIGTHSKLPATLQGVSSIYCIFFR